MAIKPIRTLKLPGLADTYSFVQDDKTLTVSGAAADAQVTGDALRAAAVSISRAERQSGEMVNELTNLYDKTARSVDTGVDATTGAAVEKSGWDLSDYIPVVAGTVYAAKVWNSGTWSTAPITNSNATLYAVYDAAKTFIESGTAAAFATDGITMPARTAYVRIMCRKNTIATAPETLVVAEKAHFPTSYVDYGSYAYSASGMLSSTISSIAPVHGSTASANITAGALLMQDGKLYQATQAIVSGAEIVPGTNAQATTIATMFAPTLVSGAITSVSQDYAIFGATDARTYVYPFGLAVAKFYFRIASNPGTTERTIATTTVKPLVQVGMTVTSQEGTYCAVFITAAGNITINTKADNANGTYHVEIVYPIAPHITT